MRQLGGMTLCVLPPSYCSINIFRALVAEKLELLCPFYRLFGKLSLASAFTASVAFLKADS